MVLFKMMEWHKVLRLETIKITNHSAAKISEDPSIFPEYVITYTLSIMKFKVSCSPIGPMDYVIEDSTTKDIRDERT